jgi:hypothetical protein
MSRWSPALPVLASVAFVLAATAIIWSAGSTLGYDFQAYAHAARRLLDGQPLYDPAVDVAGGFAIYLYPPPFAVAIVPLALVGGAAAVWAWTGMTILAFLAGVALLPVRPTVRWAILLLGALDWPVLYSIKLGQVGPLLFLLFAIGWRVIDTPARPCPPRGRLVLGGVIAIGTLIKVQPGLLVAWAALTARWRTVAAAIAVLVGIAVAATIVTGLGPWFDYPSLLGRVSSPLTTPHNFTPGAIAYQAGLAEGSAAIVEWVAVAVALVAVVVAARTRSAEASYLVAVVVSQLISPLLWDHYAMLLLLPVAWLLERRQWWAIAIPVATSVVLVGVAPAAIYPIVFVASLIGLFLADGREPKPAAAGPGAPERLLTLDSAP